jgi:ribosomal protein S18 acetylase RimI-like enzyme
MIKISNYKPIYKPYFKKLNIEWLEKYFFVEDYDKEVLSNPEKYILDKGGFIYFILENDIPVGTVAIMINESQELELTKMGMSENAKGKGFGNLLLKHVINEVINNKTHNELYLYSNTLLGPAIHLYEKYGFEEIPFESSKYKRCNIKMKLNLKNESGRN